MKTKNLLFFAFALLIMVSCSPSDLLKKLIDEDDLEELEKEGRDSEKKVVYRYTVTIHNGEHKGTHIYEETDPTYTYGQYTYDKENKKYIVVGAFQNKKHALSVLVNTAKSGAQKFKLEHPLSKSGEFITFVPPAKQHLTLRSVSGEIIAESMKFTPSDHSIEDEDFGSVTMKLTFSGTFVNFANEKEGEVEITGAVEVF